MKQLTSTRTVPTGTSASINAKRFRFGRASAKRLLVSLLIVSVVLSGPAGCRLRDQQVVFEQQLDYFNDLSAETVFPDAAAPDHDVIPVPAAPLTVNDLTQHQFIDMTLQEAIRTALDNSTVMRDLGGAVLHQPRSITSVFDPAIVDTDPRFGPEAALSDFDAQFATNVIGEKNDRALNNIFQGGGTNLLQQDLAVIESEIRKRSATGSEFMVRNHIDYDANNAVTNRFPHAWNWNVEAEIRQPLMQGAGVDFNRIAGPNATPGVFNGVMIARLDTEVGLAEFEMALRDLISNVENAYWELYFAYRHLDAKLRLRDETLTLWQEVQEHIRAGVAGATADKEALLREQYFQYQADVQNALTGRLLEPTQTRNGSSGGTFRANGGVQVAERRLRLLLGQQISDGKLIRPIEEPSTAEVLFDWEEVTAEAVFRRPELQRQRRVVKRNELELIASKNFLLPQLDTFGRYRWRGFGKDLIGRDDPMNRFDNAFSNLLDGDFQEWQLGMELIFPNGFRQANAGVRNAHLRLARGRALLYEQEREIVHDLSNAYAEMQRAYALAQTQYNRVMAARWQKHALEEEKRLGHAVDANRLLDACRRVADAESELHQALVEYVIAVKNVHYEKGSLLDYNEVFLAEDGGICVKGPIADYLKRQKQTELQDYRLKHPGGAVQNDGLHTAQPEPQLGPFTSAEFESSSMATAIHAANGGGGHEPSSAGSNAAPAAGNRVLPRLFSGRGQRTAENNPFPITIPTSRN